MLLPGSEDQSGRTQSERFISKYFFILCLAENQTFSKMTASIRSARMDSNEKYGMTYEWRRSLWGKFDFD